MKRQPPPVAARQCGVFTTAQASSYGWTRDALHWAVRRGTLIRLRRGVFREAELPDDLDPFERARWEHAAAAIAAVLTTPGAVASHSTAAVLRGLPLAFLPSVPCLTVVPVHTGDIARTHLHRCSSEPHQPPVGAVSCLSVARTVIDLAREHGVAAGVVPADFALRRGLTTFDHLEATLLFCGRWPGIVHARAAVAAADPRSESPLESRSRLKLSASDLPDPEPQVRIGDEFGSLIGRVDFYWDEFGVVGEVDGSVKYGAGSSALVDEKWRQERLERTGLKVVRWGAADLKAFDRTIDRLRSAFAAARQREQRDRRWTVLPAQPTNFDPLDRAFEL